jgi:pantoate--beta-alanine ligase
MLASTGCDLIFAPSPAEVYPPGFATSIAVARLGEGLEGAARPGHFDGVTTVVAKLLTMALPDTAVFGEKDWQQLAIVRRLVADLDMPIEIVGGPIVRDSDGLALSSRNAYLNPNQRSQAVALPGILLRTSEALASGAPVHESLAGGIASLLQAGFASVDYLSLVDAATLEPLSTLRAPARLVAAATLGTTRLLDNLPVEPLS